MKTIRLYMDYIPSHAASRGFTIQLFEELTRRGIKCELVIPGANVEERRFETKTIYHPKELSERDIQEFMNRSVINRNREYKQLLDEWNTQTWHNWVEMFTNTEVVHVNVCDAPIDMARSEAYIKGEINRTGLGVLGGLTATNAGGVPYFQYPVPTENLGHRSIYEVLTETRPSTPLYSEETMQEAMTELVSTLHIISEREIAPELLQQQGVLTEATFEPQAEIATEQGLPENILR